MLTKITTLRNRFPTQFWLIFFGMLLRTMGASMVWPFMSIFFANKLAISLTTVGYLMMINSVMSMVFAFVGGHLADKIGRKWVIVLGLMVHAIGYFFTGRASTLWEVVIFFGFCGGFGTIYNVGADSMVTDLVAEDDRPEAFSLLRLSQNVGVALGPAIGGFLSVISYTITFTAGSLAMMAFALLIMVMAKETLPAKSTEVEVEKDGGYGKVFRDSHFMIYILFMIIISLAPSLIWTMMAVYSKNLYGVSEAMFGFIPTANAIMVLLFQLPITAYFKRLNPLRASAIGALFFTIGVLSVAFMQNFTGFLISMIIATIGELIIMPTSTNYAAHLAPISMRGRYMSIYSLTWGIAYGIGPLAGGIINDSIAPVMVWYFGGLVGMVAVVGFYTMYLSSRKLENAAA